MKIVLDIWGGLYSQDHVARFIRSVDDALEMARVELEKGYLINLRGEADWGSYSDFDERKSTTQ